jgi:cyclin-dependent kinase regulatory subunit CKS1
MTPTHFLSLFDTNILYSDVYSDYCYSYRHVILPESAIKEFSRTKSSESKSELRSGLQNEYPKFYDVLVKFIDRQELLTEREWRTLGVMQSTGWTHYMISKREPFLLCMRRPLRK